MRQVNTADDQSDRVKLDIRSGDSRMRRKTKVRLLLMLTVALFCSIVAYQHLSNSDPEAIFPVHLSEDSMDSDSRDLHEERDVHSQITDVIKAEVDIIREEVKEEIQAKPAKIAVQEVKEKMKIILFMEGWVDYPEFYNSAFLMYLDYNSKDACGYKCMAYRTGERKFSSADVIVFQPSALTIEPPKKHSGQIWVLHSFFELQDYDYKNIHKHGYEDLIDFYQIRPDYILTPLEFNKELNDFEDRGFESDIKLMNHHSHKAGLIFAQLIESCEPFKAREMSAKLDSSFGYTLSQQKPGLVNVIPVLTCYGRPELLTLPTNATFVILDNSACHNAMLDQLLQIYLYESHYAIPIIPPLFHLDQIVEFREISPPASFISMEYYDDNPKMLFQHIQQVVWHWELYRGYLSWRGMYTLSTETGEH